MASGSYPLERFETRAARAARGKGKIYQVLCVNREGWVLSDCTLAIFHKLRRRRLIASQASMPYRITRDGLAAVHAQLDNR
jgi:uncharacterized protein YjhX (UPF0386 family)